ncbi:hypothetical protein ACEWY4_013009 [Coilia grayii]|uniref:Fibulin-2 domain-containing protein n=1 Tax=Coilia grayii TaxID=363190 RepID=A0ABD1JV15_9TELE
MSDCVLVRTMLLNCLLLLSISVCLCQRDCTGVDCPVLENCIEESLPSGACCATCVQKGCACQGYQYYDCVNAGFRKGKVPEGESYFVDFGSTECSCPEGGGRISCHFIPCPDIPANCIELSEPADGCIQCKRVGCEHDGQMYEAGHSFHMDPCQVCHCPNDGGSLMCYPIPDCDPSRVAKPVLATTTEQNLHERPYSNPLQFIFQHQGPRDHVSKPLRPPPGDTLPLFTQHPNNLEDEEEEEVDYDYMPTDTPGPPLQDVAAPTESSIVSVSYPESFTPLVGLRRDRKQELRETFAVQHEVARRAETTQAPTALQQTTPQHHGEVTTVSWLKALGNQVLPLETAGAADGETGGNNGDGDEDEEEGQEKEVGEEEERTLMSHAFPVFPQRENLQPPFAEGNPNQRTRGRPVTAERGSFAGRGHSQAAEIRPWMPDITSFADRGFSQAAETRPGVPERSSFAHRGHSQGTPKRPMMPEISSAVDRLECRKSAALVMVNIATVHSTGLQCQKQTALMLVDMVRSRPVLDEVDQDGVTGHRPQRLFPEYSMGPDRLLEHVTPPVVNSPERTTTTTSPGPQRVHEIHTVPPVRFFTTSQPPLRVKPDGGHPMRNQTQPLTSVHAEEGREREQERERKEERDNSLGSLPVDSRGEATASLVLMGVWKSDGLLGRAEHSTGARRLEEKLEMRCNAV